MILDQRKVMHKLEKAKPFLKWAGGKRSLTESLEALLPREFNRYWEPFVGGGALFFHLATESRGGGGLYQANLSDINYDLYLTWRGVQNHPTRLVNHLSIHKQAHDGNGYYNLVRNQYNQSLEVYKKERAPVKTAARLIYLNKTCYNGLYRVNSKGEFNTPRGDYKSPAILDEANLYACSKILNKFNVNISQKSFVNIAPKKGDLIYADPPYDETFTNYSAGGFQSSDQKVLRDTALEWHNSGALVMISSSNTPKICELYSKPPWNIQKVTARRFINSNAAKRGAVKELVIRSYK